MTKSILRKYAKLIVQMGVNIKKGQGAVILADTAQSEIALMVAEEAYRAGAKWVDIRWTNQDLDKMRYKKESVKVLSATQEWENCLLYTSVDGKEVVMQLKAGDRVITGKYTGTEVKIDGEEYTIVRQSDVLAVVE